ncbi:MAG: YihY/virulence factor BrkB family protein, partial [Acidobacteriia bacterium]|nr:YihY/virulence factor BrkB family protein [Terriglobia bacterium]
YRARMLGGRTNHYGRISLRMGPYDFKPRSRDGRGFDWPITYEQLAPLLLLVISIVGLVFGRQAVQHEIQGQIQGLIGRGPASEVGSMVQSAGQHASTGVVGAALGIVALLFGATGAFSQLQSSLNLIWRVKPDPQAGGVKSFLSHRILSMGMILAIAFLLLVSLAVSAALSALGGFVAGLLPQGFSGPLLHGIEFIVSLAIVAALFAAMFAVLPDAKIRWRDVWLGAWITSVLFTVGKFLIGLYLGHSGAATAYGAAGSLVLVVLWIYYSSIILLLGAEFTEVWATRNGAVQPKPGAVRVQQTVEPRKAA